MVRRLLCGQSRARHGLAPTVVCFGRVGVPDLSPICFFGVRVAARWVGVAGIGREGDPVGRPYAGRVSAILGPRSFAAGWVSPVRRRVGVPGGCVPGGCPRFVLSREWVFPICFLGVSVAAGWVGVPGIFGVRATQWVAPTRGAFRGFGGPDRSPPGGCPRCRLPDVAIEGDPMGRPYGARLMNPCRSQDESRESGCFRFVFSESA